MEYYQLIKYLRNDCTPSEKDAVEQWIQISPENQVQFQKLKRLWEESLSSIDAVSPDLSKAWNNIVRKTDIQQKRHERSFISSRTMKIAATLLVLVGLATFWYTLVYDKPAMLTETNDTLQKKEITLSDGTSVWLNTHAILRFPEKFKGKVREVRMEGEAFFKVARDEQHPFVVAANGTLIRVLGTSFNIKIIASEKVVVSVLSGKVAFQPADNSAQLVHLVKGELGMYNTSTHELKKEPYHDENFISWETGILKFNNSPLTEVASALSVYYSKAIKVDPRLQHRQITVSFNNLTLDEALNILEGTLDVHVVQSPSVVQINP